MESIPTRVKSMESIPTRVPPNLCNLVDKILDVQINVLAPDFFLLQRIRSTVDEKEQKQLLMDLDVVMRSSDCDFIVKFYGALFTEVDPINNLFSAYPTALPGLCPK